MVDRASTWSVVIGCHPNCKFRHFDSTGHSGIQAKDGSSNIEIGRCRFEHAGQRALNIGESTGLDFFRPNPRGYEARAISIEDCTFLGSMTPVAFVGVDGATFRHNTIYRPRRWGIRILQENRIPEFIPCRNGQVVDNLIVYRSDEMVMPVNVGEGTSAESFTLARNVWFCLDSPERRRPRLPIPEIDGAYGINPHFQDAEHGDLRLRGENSAIRAGVRSVPIGSPNLEP
ncbi:right-handed parallel beta-helix repeat-containing protein [Tundrisphaera lichenicola]|uniref:right-handed parallel beta-helix repeat-containing protein n=1 Tax=Tundrisphaera lichenicola TaxID=2029860 RepID=UPI003EBF5874